MNQCSGDAGAGNHRPASDFFSYYVFSLQELASSKRFHCKADYESRSGWKVV